MTIFSPVVTWIVEEGGGGLDLVEMERVVARHGAIQSGLEEGGPPFFLIVTISFLFVTIFYLLQSGPPVSELVRASVVVLANSSHSRVDDFSTVHKFYCRLPVLRS